MDVEWGIMVTNTPIFADGGVYEKQNLKYQKERCMMKKSKRVLNVFLVLCLLVTMLPVITMRTEAATLNESEFANKIAYLKTVYRDEEYWNGYNSVGYEGTGSKKCSCTYSCAANCSCDCGKFYLDEVKYGGQCYGFANKMAYLTFGSIPDVGTKASHGSWIYYTASNIDGFYAGDYVRVRNNAHSIFITAVNGDTVTYVDCNNYGPCQVKWDRSISMSELKSITTYAYHLSGNTLTGTGSGSLPHTHSYSGSYYETAHPHKEYQKCSCGAIRYTGGTKTVSSCTTCNPNPTPTAPVVYMDYPSGSYGLDNNIEVKGWIASNEPVSYVLCNIDGYGQISLGMWDSPDEAAQYPQYQYFKRFNGVIEADKLTADQTYNYHIFTNLNSGAYLYDGSFDTKPSTDWKIHLDTPTGHYTKYDHIELKGWLVCNEKPAYIMAELVGKRQWDMAFYESTETMSGYTYFMRFSTVIDVNLLESNQSYTVLVWSSLGGPTSFTFSTGDLIPKYYTLNYDANGGTNAPVSQSKKQLAPLQLTSTTPTRAGYTFKGWALTANASVADYQPGDEFTTDADTILYAVWEQGCDGSHSYGYRVSQSPTLDNTGVLVGSCEFCTAAVSVPLPILDDQSYTYTVQTVPGCESQGMGRYTWKVTQYGVYDFDVVLPAAGHSYQQTVIKPDCTTQGYTVHTCSVCGKSYQSDDTQPTGHSYTYQVTKAPTQTIQGTLTGSCNNCSASTQVVLPRLDTVSYTYTVTQEPTLTQTGIGCYTWNENAYGTFRFEVILEAEEEPDLDLPRITVESKTASRGQDVTLQVAIENNPGFSALQAAVRYDTQNLTLVSAENKIPSMIMTPGNSYVWDGTENYTDDGNILTLTFKINEEAPEGEYEIQLIFMSASNDAFEEVKMLGVSGTLNVIASVYGDANGDGKVTTVDLAMLRQYLSGMDPVTGESSLNIGTGADANGDGQISTVDLAMLRKYLAGMDPITGVSSVVLGPR